MIVPGDFALRVQEAGSRDALLAVCSLAVARSADGWFLTRDVSTLFKMLRIPSPGNLGRDLRRLESDDLLIADDAKARIRWTLTPVGEREAGSRWGVDEEFARSDLGLSDPSHGVFQPLVPPEFAPAEWAGRIADFNTENPFATNVFLMTRFPSGPSDADLATAMTAARTALTSVGLNLHVASDVQVVDDLWGNVAAHIWSCKYGLAFVEGDIDQGLNENMLIELGSMIALGRRCLILKDHESAPMPTDLLGRIYQSVDFSDPGTVVGAIEDWVRGLPDLNRQVD